MRWTVSLVTLWAAIAALWAQAGTPGSAAEHAHRLQVSSTLVQYHQEPDPLQRAALIDAIQRRGSPAYQPLLDAAALDPDARVRRAVRHAPARWP